MNISPVGIALIKKFEGLKLIAYKCSADRWTVGYGHTTGVTEGKHITSSEAETLLAGDLEAVELAIHSLVKEELTQNEYDALCSFVFNLGAGAFAKSTLLKYIKVGNKISAGNEFLKWDKAAKKQLPGLTKRRNEERELFIKQS